MNIKWRTVQILLSCSALALVATVGVAQTIRLANGIIVKGDVIESSDKGLIVNTSKGDKTYEWFMLSPATRYYYEPVFSANYDVVLRGLPPSRRVKVAMPDIVSSQEDIPVQREEQDNGTEQKPVTRNRSLLLVDQIMYENIDPVRAAALPDLDLRSAASATYWGLQYGPLRQQVVYFAFDSKDVNDLRDVLFMYGLEDAFNKTTRIKAMKKRDGNQYYAKYRDIEFDSEFGNIKAHFEVSFTYTIGTPKDLMVIINVTLEAAGEKSEFELFGQPTDLIYSEGTINVRGVLDLPVLWVSLDPASTTPRLVGDLRMSRMKLCPIKGMDTSLIIEVREQQSNDIVQRQVLELDEDMFNREYGIVADMNRMKPGQSYHVKASIDLGPFLGDVICEETVHVPNAP